MKTAEKVAAVRQRLYDMGLYGTRASVVVGDPVTYPFSPYLASLVVSETADDLAQAEEQALAQAVFHALRPYGGVACAWGALADRSRIEELVREGSFPGASVGEAGDFVLLTRSGPLPGAADWSHAEANAASTGASEDEFIRSPMAVLWFDAAQRWHKYPGQILVRVAGGRIVLFEEGVLRATDVYTGRQLWEVDVPFGVNPMSESGARETVWYARHRQWGPEPSIPSNAEFVVLPDAIYLSAGSSCLVVDPATGEVAGQIEPPEGLDRPWANLRACGRLLGGQQWALPGMCRSPHRQVAMASRSDT